MGFAFQDCRSNRSYRAQRGADKASGRPSPMEPPRQRLETGHHLDVRSARHRDTSGSFGRKCPPGLDERAAAHVVQRKRLTDRASSQERASAATVALCAVGDPVRHEGGACGTPFVPVERGYAVRSIVTSRDWRDPSKDPCSAVNSSGVGRPPSPQRTRRKSRSSHIGPLGRGSVS